MNDIQVRWCKLRLMLSRASAQWLSALIRVDCELRFARAVQRLTAMRCVECTT